MELMNSDDKGIKEKIQTKVQIFNSYVDAFLKKSPLPQFEPCQKLKESVQYSLTNGGKRFRPTLTLLTCDLLGKQAEVALPFALAVEMIHTYSLIHDDLPCMDNDEIRRGKPTNHKVFGEATALLAGDALLTESIGLVLESYKEQPALANQLVTLLVKAAGWQGMISGQMIDIFADSRIDLKTLQSMHELKTGAMIRVAVVGGALISGASPAQMDHLEKFGSSLGLAFQIADDILDQDEKAQDGRSYVLLLGLEKTRDLLKNISDTAFHHLQSVGENSELEYLIDYNIRREL
jgi:geranylgeranyl diphosphate synthase type II